MIQAYYYNLDDIYFHDGYVKVKGLGTVGKWWKHYDGKVCLSYGFGGSFFASTEDEVKETVLKILNAKKN